MKKTIFFLVATMIAWSSSSTVQASGPLRSMFGDGCDSACSDGCAGPACDTGCDSHGGYGDRLRTLWKSNDDCCPESCCYVSLFGGWSFLHDYNSDIFPGGVTSTFSDGWAIGGAVGRRFGHGLRGELEAGFRSNTADQVFAGGGAFDHSGHVFAYTAMANMYYDISALEIAGVTPYIGGGIGVAAFDADISTPLGPSDVHDAAFAYQGIAGAAKRINRNIDLFAEYRYLGNTDVTVDINGASAAQARPEYENVFFGVRFNR
ncbi:outer membrane protein [Allorhodopirellula heiligendammensis]|uniref:Surface antigen n=1 Tax=Allorhodopirellula heiligendammensis TaxID=2714739 RepID=A0A5C6C202_9BACT|nr:outer membrane beta-barrel protein [Allorhodopirellula heiligendammensis]TWU18192.1 Surface antigen [Allorhodopirellula heiligendammensis]|tara:strand:+ start:1280 stop:2065 length:786 start_codon:yes stop_codon:yes gene_type:complete